MRRLHRTVLRRGAGSIATSLVAAWLAACESGPSPVAPTASDTALPAEAVVLTFAPPGAPAARLATLPEGGVSVSRTVADGESTVLRVFDLGEPDRRDDLEVRFAIPDGAAPAGTVVAMTVRGDALSRLQVGFTPAGLRFARPAVLRLDLGRDLVDTDLSLLEVYHGFADGTSVLVPYRLEEYRESIRILIAVPGFSRYSLSDGE